MSAAGRRAIVNIASASVTRLCGSAQSAMRPRRRAGCALARTALQYSSKGVCVNRSSPRASATRCRGSARGHAPARRRRAAQDAVSRIPLGFNGGWPATRYAGAAILHPTRPASSPSPRLLVDGGMTTGAIDSYSPSPGREVDRVSLSNVFRVG